MYKYYYKINSDIFEFIPSETPTETIVICNSKQNITEIVVPPCKVLECTHNNSLTKLVVEEGCHTVYCNNNNISELILPSSVTYLNCSNNNLNNLEIPYNCRSINCSSNNIKNLKVPINVNSLDCSYNIITDIDFHTNYLETLTCYSNKLTELNIENCLNLNCGANYKLANLKVPKNCQSFWCHLTSINSIIIPKNCYTNIDKNIIVSYYEDLDLILKKAMKFTDLKYLNNESLIIKLYYEKSYLKRLLNELF